MGWWLYVVLVLWSRSGQITKNKYKSLVVIIREEEFDNDPHC